jgi:hypothetical protein
VKVDRTDADVEPRGDFSISTAFRGQTTDLCFPSRQISGGFDAGPWDTLATCSQLAGSAFDVDVIPHPDEHLVCGMQLLSRLKISTLSAEPFAIVQMRTSKLHEDAGAPKSLNRIDLQTLRLRLVAQQSSTSGFYSQCPF